MNRSELSNIPKDTTFYERRKKADWVTKMATILSVVSWIISFVVLLVLDLARPENENMFTRFFNIPVRDYWDTAVLSVAFILLILSLGSCVFAFIFNMLRMRRKTDKYKKSIIVIGVISLLGIVFFVLRFGVL